MLFVYMVLIVGLIVGVVFVFLFMSAFEHVQESFNPYLAEENWVSEEHYVAFGYAAGLVTNIWTYFIGFVVFILAFWAYVYNQRRGAGYA